MEDESNRRKGWAILTAKTVLAAVPSIARLALIILLGLLIALGADMFGQYSEELKDLVDAGTLPDCLYYYPLGMFTMLIGAVMILFVLRRK